MKNSLVTTLMLFISLHCSVVSAQDMSAMMKQQMQDSMSAMCRDKAFLSCTGVGQKKCVSAATKTMSSCDHLFPKNNTAMGNGEAFMAHGNCMETRFPKNIGVSVSKLDTCDSIAGSGPTAGTPPMDMNQGIAMMNQMMQQHAQSVGTDSVTLPVYKKATVMSHFANGELNGMYQDMGVKPLPALMLASPDSVNKIAKYYRGKLKGFREHQIDNQILFLKGGPKNYNDMAHMKILATTPHVRIAPVQGIPGTPAGTRSQIEVAYKK